jgi:hypothetical protein
MATDPSQNVTAFSTGNAPESDISSAEYRSSFGEDFQDTLDLNTWTTGEDLSSLYGGGNSVGA